MKKNFQASLILVFLGGLMFPTLGFSQSCKDTINLLKVPGKLIDHNSAPTGGFVSDYSAAEKATAYKTMKTIEEICKKNFYLSGGIAKADFDFREKYFFDKYYHVTSAYKIGFYSFLCDKGVIKPDHEYGTDISIVVNPQLNYYFSPDEIRNFSNYYSDPAKNTGPMISLFRMIVIPDKKKAESINNGSGYVEDTTGGGGAYDPDIYRTWYLTKPGKKLLAEVTRKEYLESLMEFYEREKVSLNETNESRIAESKKYMDSYQKSGNTAMYQSHLENKQKAEKELADIVFRYETKKAKVAGLLKSMTESWLQQPAVINPKIKNNSYCDSDDDFKKTGYFTFTHFSDNESGDLVYKWNPDYFKEQLQSPAAPLFIKVSFRYKAKTAFSTNVRDNFMKNLDLLSISKLVVSK